MTADRRQAFAPPPPVATLISLPADAWAWLLPHVRAVLHGLPDREVTAATRRLRAAPASRLAGGRTRRELAALLAGSEAIWQALVDRLEGIGGVPAAVADVLRGVDGGAAVGKPDTASSEDVRRSIPGTAEAQEAADRARVRARELRAERDDARRRAEGAEARAAALIREVAGLERRVRDLEGELAQARAELEEAGASERRAVERAQRRRDADVARLESQLTALRRQEEERRIAEQRRAAARKRAEQERAAAAAGRDEAVPTGVLPGRPTRLPEGVEPNTREAVELLLHPGRLVLVDGYNVTLQHQASLELAEQRAWLEQRLAVLAARLKIRPVVVFDGAEGGSGSRSTRGVEVRFSPAGVTADDELDLAVQATDEPVVVVTDDRELAGRVAAAGADVVGTTPFLWVAK